MNRRSWFFTLLLLATAWMATTTGCTKVDNTLGSHMIPSHQIMKAGVDTVRGINGYQAQVDSIATSSSYQGYIGKLNSTAYGEYKAAWIGQYTPIAFSVEDVSFGEGAKADSLQLYLFPLVGVECYGDSLLPQTLNVYELKTRLHKDSVFYSNFDYKAAVYPELLTTIELTKGLARSAYRLDGAQATTLMQRLLNESDNVYKGGTANDSLFVDRNCGICIAPAESSPSAFIQTIDYASCEMVFYTHRPKTAAEMEAERERAEEENWGSDYEIQPDTSVKVRYGFSSTTSPLVNFPAFEVDHTNATAIDLSSINDTLTTSTPATVSYVQGEGGVSTLLRFTEDFTANLLGLIEKPFTQLVVTSATLELPIADPTLDVLKNSFFRMGSYSAYSPDLTPIIDYSYWDEQNSSNPVVLPYGGYLNRSQNSYTINITGFVQKMAQAKEITDYTMMLAPSVGVDLYAPQAVGLEVGPTLTRPQGLEVKLIYVLTTL